MFINYIKFINLTDHLFQVILFQGEENGKVNSDIDNLPDVFRNFCSSCYSLRGSNAVYRRRSVYSKNFV